MVKLIVLFRKPADPAAFDRQYRETHLPLAAKIPGLIRTEIAKTFGSPTGEAQFYQVAELYFENKEALFAGLQSPESKASGKNLMSFAGDVVQMMFASIE